MKRNLPAIQQSSLTRVRSNLDILNKLVKYQASIIGTKLRKRLIELMLKNQDFFLKMVSWKYPINNEMLLKYKKYWIFGERGFPDIGLLFNKVIPFSSLLISTIEDQINWHMLIVDSNTKWMPESIVKYQNQIITEVSVFEDYP